MDNVFYCYSPTLCSELKRIGERYIAVSTNQDTNRKCWIFLFNNNLKRYLDNRPKATDKYVKNNPNPKFN